MAEVRSVLAGTSKRYDAIELIGSDADAVLAALGVARPAVASRLVLAPDAAKLAKDLVANRKRLGFLRADEIGPSVRALSWGRDALFGVGRVATLAAWPLIAHVPAGTASPEPEYDPAGAWTLFAGGDIMLDRGVAKTVTVEGRGVDFPFNGGTADITGHTCCSQFGWRQPLTKRTGNAGVVRALVKGADLAIANFENPAPDRFRWHTTGTVFSANPRLIDGLRNAGIDYVSLGNNHIRDAGANGIIQTIANLEKRGIAWSGAGRNLAQARRPAMLDAGGTKVAVLGYDTIAKYYAASATRAGSAQMTAAVVKADVAAARKAGADLVIVFPHWGTEYDATPFAGQQRLARAAIDAGADIVIGNHAHWAAAMEIYKGRPIWYALGNFVFDQVWSEPTMEGITLELTFVGKELRQIRMRPHIILNRAQPNFLDPAGDGRVVMGQVFAASKGLLPW
ncbi:MAG: CapA family protein [Chloroflexota bacterium]